MKINSATRYLVNYVCIISLNARTLTYLYSSIHASNQIRNELAQNLYLYAALAHGGGVSSAVQRVVYSLLRRL